MHNVVKMAALAMIAVAGVASAIDSEPTARPKAVQCPVPCPTPQPAPKGPPAINPSQTPAAAPGLTAQVGSAALVDISSEKLETKRVQVHTYKKELAVEEFAVKVPYEYTVKVPYVVEQTRPIQMTGSYDVTRNHYVPVTNTYQVPYRYCDRCTGQYVSGTNSYTQTTMVNKPYTDSVQYSYTKNISEQRVLERDETRVGLKDGVDTKVVERIVPAIDEYDIMKSRVTLTYETTAISPVPKSR